jgi:hypothetical protein
MATYEIKPEDSLQTAVTRAQSGDTIRVLPGTHHGKVELRTNGIEVISAEPDQAITNGFVFPEGSRDIVLQDFLCKGDQHTNQFGCIFIEGEDHVVSGNTVRDVAGISGIAMQWRQNEADEYRNRNVTVEKNVIENCQAGIGAVGHDITVQDNVIRGLNRFDTGQDSDFFVFFGHTIRILRNACFDGVRQTGSAHTDGGQTYVTGSNPKAFARDLRIEGNLFQDCDQGLMLECWQPGQVEDIVVLDNIFHQCMNWGVSARGDGEKVGGVEGVEIARNVFHEVNHPEQGAPAAVGVRGPNGFGTVRQNIFSRCNGSWFFSDGAKGQGIDNVVWDYNRRDGRPQPGDVLADPAFVGEGNVESLADARKFYTPTNSDVIALHAGLNLDA